jgi:hypothetical protein
LRRGDQAADPQIQHFVAVFEYMIGIRPRPGQLEKLIFAIQKICAGDISGGSALIRHLMGRENKSSHPIHMLWISMRKDLFPLMVFYSSQMSAVELELGSILLNDIGLKFVVLSIPFADMRNTRQLAIFSDRVEMALLNREQVLATESCCSAICH